MVGKAVTTRLVGMGYGHFGALRKNIAYNFQYIEYLDKSGTELKLTSVIVTQTWKILVVVGCGIVESLLYYLLVSKDLHTKNEWKLVDTFSGNPSKINGVTTKIDSVIYTKMNSKQPVKMKFEAILKKAKDKKILGPDHSICTSLKYLRGLRNKIHLQDTMDDNDTDWNSFLWADACKMAEVLHLILTSKIFKPTDQEERYFDYLLRYKVLRNDVGI